MTDRYSSYADLAANEVEGRAYRVSVTRRRVSKVAVIAPHGGRIELRTSEVAREVAGRSFNLYLFEGILPADNARLHITSHLFDEPRCLALVAKCDTVVAIHGCKGSRAEVLLGGRDSGLKRVMARTLRSAGIAVRTRGHAFPGTERENICNRGRTRKGVQLELTRAIRGSAQEPILIARLRTLLSGDSRGAAFRIGAAMGAVRSRDRGTPLQRCVER